MNRGFVPRTLAHSWLMTALCLSLVACSPSAGPDVRDGASAAAHPADQTTPSARALRETNTIPLAPGTYRFSVAANPGIPTPEALVDVPAGYDEEAPWYVVSHSRDEYLGLWTVGLVDRDACFDGGEDAFDPGPSVEDMADALVAQKSTRATAPEPVTLAGHEGLYVELRSPADMDKCDPEAGLWGDPGGRGIYSDGQVDLVWILDLDGRRLVVNAAYNRTSSAADMDKLTSMVESLRFVAAAQG